MKSYCITISPQTAFSTPLKGDTLFGQLCWMILESQGQERLEELLLDYTENQPFMICSDAFPTGYIPRPEYPLFVYDKVEGDRKQIKKKRWLEISDVNKPVQSWLGYYRDDAEAGNNSAKTISQTHNSINRQTGTTTGEAFTPYQSDQTWYNSQLKLDIWILIDEQRISENELRDAINMAGQTGFGKDASTGLGKFNLISIIAEALYSEESANTAITLAPAILSDQNFDPAHSYYSVFTRFGRHGVQALATGKPFKNPILLADTAAVLASKYLKNVPFVGRGLGGQGQLSKAISATVHQGYAPCIKVNNKGIF
jgi:CRISPR-associated protein Csm4